MVGTNITDGQTTTGFVGLNQVVVALVQVPAATGSMQLLLTGGNTTGTSISAR